MTAASRRPDAGRQRVVAVVAVVLVRRSSYVMVIDVGGSKTNHVTAYFTETVGLYTGNDVRILGVKVGKIDSITPEGTAGEGRHVLRRATTSCRRRLTP